MVSAMGSRHRQGACSHFQDERVVSNMKANWFGRAVTLSSGFVALATLACSSGSFEPQGVEEASESASEELGQSEQGLMSCSNPDGTNSVMAAFAVAVAQELGRWNASKDFVVNLS